jgi:Ceramidase
MTRLSNHTKLSRPSAWSSRVAVIVTLTAASLLGLLLLPSIPQDQQYHQFADQRAWFGIPNFWNVTSNLPFIAVGAAGLWRFHRRPTTAVIFLGILLTGFGSSFYHWDPTDNTLFWDRLPMTLCFMAILAATVEDRVDQRMGAALLWPLLTIGVFSLLLWRWTGDLRLYAWVQFFPYLALPLLFVLFRPRHTRSIYWVIAAALYAIAKLFEFYDYEIYSALTIVSGHTLKHFAAAGACFAVLRYFQTRRPITQT